MWHGDIKLQVCTFLIFKEVGKQSVPADFVRFEFALLVVWLVSVIAALIFALVIVSTVTLLSWLYQAITTDWLARLCCIIHEPTQTQMCTQKENRQSVQSQIHLSLLSLE